MPAIFVKRIIKDVLGTNIAERYTLNRRPVVNTETCGPTGVPRTRLGLAGSQHLEVRRVNYLSIDMPEYNVYST